MLGACRKMHDTVPTAPGKPLAQQELHQAVTLPVRMHHHPLCDRKPSALLQTRKFRNPKFFAWESVANPENHLRKKFSIRTGNAEHGVRIVQMGGEILAGALYDKAGRARMTQSVRNNILKGNDARQIVRF